MRNSYYLLTSFRIGIFVLANCPAKSTLNAKIPTTKQNWPNNSDRSGGVEQYSDNTPPMLKISRSNQEYDYGYAPFMCSAEGEARVWCFLNARFSGEPRSLCVESGIRESVSLDKKSPLLFATLLPNSRLPKSIISVFSSPVYLITDTICLLIQCRLAHRLFDRSIPWPDSVVRL